jgi:hypothetical protein
MATRLDIRSAASFDFDDADTVEMELTPEQMLVLRQAAVVSQSPPAPPVLVPAPLVVVRRIEYSEPVKRRVGKRLAVALGIVGAAVVLSGVAYVAGKRSAPVQIVTASPPPLPPAPVPAVEPQRVELPVAQVEPVRFRNPFDRNEVFEFPAGTTQVEARDAVAELLLERARQRQNPNNTIEHATNGLVQSR